MVGKHKTRTGARRILFAAAVAGLVGAADNAWAVNRSWTGGSGDGLWSTSGNWAAAIPGTSDAAILGDGASGVVVPDGPVTISVSTQPATFSAVQFQTNGSRAYTINGAAGTYFRLTSVGFDVTNQAATATNRGTFNIGLQAGDIGGIGTNGTATLSLLAANLTLNGDLSQEDPLDTGTVVFGGAGTHYLNFNNLTNGSLSFNAAADFVILNANAVNNRAIATTSTTTQATLSFAVDTSFGKLTEGDTTTGFTVRNLGHIFRNYTASPTGERVVTFNNRLTGANFPISISANPLGGSSAMRIRYLANAASTPSLTLRSDSVFELGGENATQLFDTSGSVQQFGPVSGEGRVEVTGAGRHTIATAYTHTGGTFIYKGELRLAGTLAAMPTTGELYIASGAYFNVNNRTPTIGRLTGDGIMQMTTDPLVTAGPTVTVNQGIAPGSTVAGGGLGTLEVNAPGTLTLAAGTSTFELGKLSSHDKVVFGDSAGHLTLGGDLQILQIGDEMQVGKYTLFDLAGGTATGSFANLLLPTGIEGTIDTSSGDVVLDVTTVPEPASAGLIGLVAAAGLRRRRAKRHV